MTIGNPSTNDHGDAEMVAIKRRLYLWVLGVLSLGIGALVVTPASDILVTGVVGRLAPALVVLVLGLFLLLWCRPGTLRFVELTVYAAMTPIFLVDLTAGLHAAVDVVSIERIVYACAVRSPIVIVWGFLTFGALRGLQAASVFMLVTVTVFGVFAAAGDVAGRQGIIYFGIYVGSTIVFVVALFTFARLLEKQISARASAEVIAEFALKDVLTGLPNRLALEARFDHARASAQRSEHLLAVCFIDLDDFKIVNDRHGHAAGDDVLRQFGARVAASMRASDSVARIGGDEYVVLATVPDERQAHALVERLLAASAAPYAHDTIEVVVGASIGLSVFPRDGTDLDTLLRSADGSMYRTKRTGKVPAVVPAERPTAVAASPSHREPPAERAAP